MIICSRCFRDIEIVSLIEGIGNKGECPFCHGKDSFLYDTDMNIDLVEHFDDLVNIYTPEVSLGKDYPEADLRDLKHELLDNWNIFNNLDHKQIYAIITSICKERYQAAPEYFTHPLGISELYKQDYLDQHSLLRTNSWSEFVLSLKTINRYHNHHINTDVFQRFCSYIRKPYKKGATFYRGRISSASGLPMSEMGPPPSSKISAGRANAEGIKCLYVANDVETTIHEVRAGAFDYITIGQFELLEDIIIVDLKLINKISPFTPGLDLKEYAINKEHLNRINEEMGKALRRSDSTLDYVPTQYISDFIKSIEHNGLAEYAGVEYNSTMNKAGYNVAIFYPELFKCIKVETYKINNLTYQKEKIS